MRTERSRAAEIIEGVAGLFTRPRPVVSAPPAPRMPDNPVVAALARAGTPLTNQQLARAMGCSEGQASKLRRKAKAHLIEWRQGRYVFAALANFHDETTVSARKLKRKVRGK